jgi:kinesin family protein 5
MTAPIPSSSDDDEDIIKESTPTKKKSPSTNNVRVVGRIRPMAQYEVENGSKTVVVKTPTTKDHVGPETLQINNGPGEEKRWFELDAILDHTNTQEQVYTKSGARQAIAEDLFDGFNCTILAYGQTGAGKVRK